MPSEQPPVLDSDYRQGSTQTSTSVSPALPQRAGPASETIPTNVSDLPLLRVPVEANRYGIEKPQRTIIRGKITRDKR